MLFFRNCLRKENSNERAISSRETARGEFRETRRYKVVSREDSCLLSACWDEDWTLLKELCHSHPEQTFWKSRYSGRTCLHLATMPGCVPPAGVLRALVEANPFATVENDNHQDTPLHFCCGSKLSDDLEIVQLLVDAAISPEVNVLGIRKRTSRINYDSPLFRAVRRDAPPATLQVLVDAARQQSWIGPWVGSEPFSHAHKYACNSPLSCAFQSFQDHTKDQVSLDFDQMLEIADIIIANGRVSQDDRLLRQENDSQSISYVNDWVKIVILLLPELKDSNTLLHVASNMHQPNPELLRMIARMYPEHHLASNSQGYIPLHLAVLSPRHPFVRLDSDKDCAISILLDACPDAAIRQAPQSNLFPAFLAATCDSSLSTILEIILRAPNVLEMQRQYFFKMSQINTITLT